METGLTIPQQVFDGFFSRRLPRDGFTMDELYRDYFGLIASPDGSHSPLQGYAIGMNGDVAVTELHPARKEQK